jgi:hypothetical protein
MKKRIAPNTYVDVIGDVARAKTQQAAQVIALLGAVIGDRPEIEAAFLYFYGDDYDPDFLPWPHERNAEWADEVRQQLKNEASK